MGWESVVPDPYSSQLPSASISAAKSIKVMMQAGLANKCLILAPPACIPQWMRALSQYFDENQLCQITKKHIEKLSDPDIRVFVTSYSMLGTRYRNGLPGGLCGQVCWGDTLASRDWDIVVADEAHQIKNPQAKRSIFTYAIGDRASKKIAITGCPVLNTLADVWGIFRFIAPDVFGCSYKTFLTEHFKWTKHPWVRTYMVLRPIEKEAQDLILQKMRGVKGICWEREQYDTIKI